MAWAALLSAGMFRALCPSPGEDRACRLHIGGELGCKKRWGVQVLVQFKSQGAVLAARQS